MLTVVLAILPIALLFVLMVGLKMPAIRAMPIAWILTLALGILYWQMPAEVLGAANIKGLLVTIDIIIILFGAIFLLEILKQAGFIERIDKILKEVCPDKRVGAVIVAWSFGCLIEGAAGFGTPAALSAPLIVSLGVAPAPAVALALLTDSTPVSFGALGTPINIGINEALGGASEHMLASITWNTALIHGIIGLFIPFLLVIVLTLFEKKSLRTALPLLPFSLFAGASFVIPYFLIANIAGATFPSLIGGMISLVLVFLAARHHWFLPRTKKKLVFDSKKAIWVFSPYIFASFLLVLSKVPIISEFLKSFSIPISNLWNTGIAHTFAPLVNPGIAFFVAAIVTAMFMKLSKNKMRDAAKNTWDKGLYTFIALAFTIGLVQMFLNSHTNLAQIESMPIAIAQFLSDLFGQLYIFAAPQIGLFGAFLAGSNTVSNIFFGGFQQAAAQSLGLPVAIILALQVVGGAAGNMIAVHNVIAASATVGLNGKEGEIIKYNILPSIGYALLASIIAFIIINLI